MTLIDLRNAKVYAFSIYTTGKLIQTRKAMIKNNDDFKIQGMAGYVVTPS